MAAAISARKKRRSCSRRSIGATSDVTVLGGVRCPTPRSRPAPSAPRPVSRWPAARPPWPRGRSGGKPGRLRHHAQGRVEPPVGAATGGRSARDPRARRVAAHRVGPEILRIELAFADGERVHQPRADAAVARRAAADAGPRSAFEPDRTDPEQRSPPHGTPHRHHTMVGVAASHTGHDRSARRLAGRGAVWHRRLRRSPVARNRIKPPLAVTPADKQRVRVVPPRREETPEWPRSVFPASMPKASEGPCPTSSRPTECAASAPRAPNRFGCRGRHRVARLWFADGGAPRQRRDPVAGAPRRRSHGALGTRRSQSSRRHAARVDRPQAPRAADMVDRVLRPGSHAGPARSGPRHGHEALLLRIEPRRCRGPRCTSARAVSRGGDRRPRVAAVPPVDRRGVRRAGARCAPPTPSRLGRPRHAEAGRLRRCAIATSSGRCCVAVGAAFDFHAGAKKQAPRWVQRVRHGVGLPPVWPNRGGCGSATSSATPSSSGACCATSRRSSSADNPARWVGSGPLEVGVDHHRHELERQFGFHPRSRAAFDGSPSRKSTSAGR